MCHVSQCCCCSCSFCSFSVRLAALYKWILSLSPRHHFRGKLHGLLQIIRERDTSTEDSTYVYVCSIEMCAPPPASICIDAFLSCIVFFFFLSKRGRRERLSSCSYRRKSEPKSIFIPPSFAPLQEKTNSAIDSPTQPTTRE